MDPQDKITEAVMAASRMQDDRRVLPCEEALALARRLDVAPGQIGRLCDQLEIRIVNCQLGCFS